MKRTLLSIALISVFSAPAMAANLFPTNYGSTLSGEYEVNQTVINLTQGTGRSPKFYQVGGEGATIAFSADTEIILSDVKGRGHSSLFNNTSSSVPSLSFIGNGHHLTAKHISVSNGSYAGDISTFEGGNFHFSGLSSLTIDNTYKTTQSKTQNVGYGLYLLGESSILSTEDHKLQSVDITLTSKETVNQLNALRLSTGSILKTDADVVHLKVSLNEQEGYSGNRIPSSGIVFKYDYENDPLAASFVNSNPNSTLAIDVRSQSGYVAAISYEDKIGTASIITNTLTATVHSVDSLASGLYIGPNKSSTKGSSIKLDASLANFTVTSENGRACGIEFYDYDRYDGTINFNGNVAFSITSNDVDGWAAGLESSNQNAHIIFEKDASFSIKGKNSVYGLEILSSYGYGSSAGWAVSQTNATFNGNVYIQVESDNPDANAFAIKNTGGDIKMGVTEDGQSTNGKQVQILGDICWK